MVKIWRESDIDVDYDDAKNILETAITQADNAISRAKNRLGVAQRSGNVAEIEKAQKEVDAATSKKFDFVDAQGDLGETPEAPTNSQIESKSAEIENLNHKLATLENNFTGGLINDMDVAEQSARLTEQINAAKSELKELQTQAQNESDNKYANNVLSKVFGERQTARKETSVENKSTAQQQTELDDLNRQIQEIDFQLDNSPEFPDKLFEKREILISRINSINQNQPDYSADKLLTETNETDNPLQRNGETLQNDLKQKISELDTQRRQLSDELGNADDDSKLELQRQLHAVNDEYDKSIAHLEKLEQKEQRLASLTPLQRATEELAQLKKRYTDAGKRLQAAQKKGDKSAESAIYDELQNNREQQKIKNDEIERLKAEQSAEKQRQAEQKRLAAAEKQRQSQMTLDELKQESADLLNEKNSLQPARESSDENLRNAANRRLKEITLQMDEIKRAVNQITKYRTPKQEFSRLERNLKALKAKLAKTTDDAEIARLNDEIESLTEQMDAKKSEIDNAEESKKRRVSTNWTTIIKSCLTSNAN